MLSKTKVLSYVKDNLAFPSQFIELTDDKILDYISKYTLVEFSRYFPYVKKLGINLQLASNKLEDKANEYYIFEPENLEILNIKEIYFPISSLLIHGHPIMGPLTFGQLREWALNAEVANMLKQFSSWDFTWAFKHPNTFRVSPVPDNMDWITVEYETVQPVDLRGIPNEFQTLFCRFALSDIMVLIGRIRRKYGAGNLRTPFGEIPLSGDEMFQEGTEMRREIMEQMESHAIPNVTVAFG